MAHAGVDHLWPPGGGAVNARQTQAPTMIRAVIVHDARAAALEALRSPEGLTVIQSAYMSDRGMRGAFGR